MSFLRFLRQPKEDLKKKQILELYELLSWESLKEESKREICMPPSFDGFPLKTNKILLEKIQERFPNIISLTQFENIARKILYEGLIYTQTSEKTIKILKSNNFEEGDEFRYFGIENVFEFYSPVKYYIENNIPLNKIMGEVKRFIILISNCGWFPSVVL